MGMREREKEKKVLEIFLNDGNSDPVQQPNEIQNKKIVILLNGHPGWIYIYKHRSI